MGATGVVAPAAHAAADVTLVPNRIVGFSGHAGLYGWGATTMRDGSVLIGDYWNKRVLHYATDGTYLGVFIQNVGYGATQHQSPYGLGVDPDTGDVYMCDTDRRQVDRYSETGVYLNSFGVERRLGRHPGQVQVPVARRGARRLRLHLRHVGEPDRRLPPDRHRRGVVLRNDRHRTRCSSSSPARSTSTPPVGSTSANQGNKRVEVFTVDHAQKTPVYVRTHRQQVQRSDRVAARRRRDPRRPARSRRRQGQ